MSDFYDLMRAINTGGSGGGGTSNYNQLSNKPSVNNVILQGNKSLSDLGLYSKSEVDALVSGGGGNIIETEIEFVEETYEEDGEEYTELVLKFTNEEAIINAVFGEEFDRLNSLLFAIKFKPLFNPVPEEYEFTVIPDEVIEYFRAVSDMEDGYYSISLFTPLFPSWNHITNRFYTLYRRNGDYSTPSPAYGTIKNVTCNIYCYPVYDENEKVIGLNIDYSNCVNFYRGYINEDKQESFLVPMHFFIGDIDTGFYSFDTEEYFQEMGRTYTFSEELYTCYIKQSVSTNTDKIQDANIGVKYSIINENCKIEVEGTISLLDGATYAMNENVFVIGGLPPILNTISSHLKIDGEAYSNGEFVGFLELVGLNVDNGGNTRLNIFTTEPITGIDTIKFSTSYYTTTMYFPSL